MFSTKEFVAKYEAYNDDKLFEVYTDRNNYTEEAREALDLVIAQRGGIDNLLKRQAEKQKAANEESRLSTEAAELFKSGSDVSFAKKMISSDILTQDRVHEIIDNEFHVRELEKEDLRIKPRTVYGSIIGGAIASLVSGILWGAVLIYSMRVFFILIVAMALLNYSIIKGFTKQSKKNIVVNITTIISVLIALFLGWAIAGIIGYRGFSPE